MSRCGSVPGAEINNLPQGLCPGRDASPQKGQCGSSRAAQEVCCQSSAPCVASGKPTLPTADFLTLTSGKMSCPTVISCPVNLSSLLVAFSFLFLQRKRIHFARENKLPTLKSWSLQVCLSARPSKGPLQLTALPSHVLLGRHPPDS